jgi:hypothetical protein
MRRPPPISLESLTKPLKKSSSGEPDPRSKYRLADLVPLKPPKDRRKASPTLARIGTKLTIPLGIWSQAGSPVYYLKAIHEPSGELHLTPSTQSNPDARKYDNTEHRRRSVTRVQLTPEECLKWLPGEYPVRTQDVLGILTIIIGPLSPR